MTKLKPCPFCGGEAYYDADNVVEYNGHEHQHGYIGCKNCDFEIWSDTPCSCCHDITEDVVNKWNARTEPTPALDTVSEAPANE